MEGERRNGSGEGGVVSYLVKLMIKVAWDVLPFAHFRFRYEVILLHTGEGGR